MRVLDIFLVENNPIDTYLIKVFIEEKGIKCDIHIFENGELLYNYLKNSVKKSGARFGSIGF